MNIRNDFIREALVDFPDDAIKATEPVTPAHLDSLMVALKQCGIRRVSWIYYADGHGGPLLPAMKLPNEEYGHWDVLVETYNLLGNPLRVATEAAHRHGLEMYAYFKPYETGPAISFPEGSSEAAAFGRLAQLGGRLGWLDRFVMDHPHLRIRRRMDDLPANIASIPIHAIKLFKKDASPTRVTKDHLQIWTSPLNYRYQKRDIKFEVQESVEPAGKDIYDINDILLTRKGDPVRVLTLSGFSLTDPFIMVTTDFTEGPADFENVGPDIMVALDKNGKEIPGVFAPGSAIWMAEQVDFRNWGLIHDHGYGRLRLCLDEPNTSGKRGVIGYTRGRNEYLPGALCETEPAVQAYWLACLREMLEMGVDGVDFREENHSTHTDYPEDYGYNQIVLDQAKSSDPAAIAKVRGEAYTEFLRQSKKMIASYGKRMRINFQIDWYRNNPPRSRHLAYPANLNFDWQTWIAEGLLDEGMVRFFALPFDSVFNDDVAREITDLCRRKNLPVYVNRYIQPQTLKDEYRRVYEDGRFAGFIIYEVASYTKYTPGGGCVVTMDEVKELG
jgi:hypothetical protein